MLMCLSSTTTRYASPVSVKIILPYVELKRYRAKLFPPSSLSEAFTRWIELDAMAATASLCRGGRISEATTTPSRVTIIDPLTPTSLFRLSRTSLMVLLSHREQGNELFDGRVQIFFLRRGVGQDADHVPLPLRHGHPAQRRVQLAAHERPEIHLAGRILGAAEDVLEELGEAVLGHHAARVRRIRLAVPRQHRGALVAVHALEARQERLDLRALHLDRGRAGRGVEDAPDLFPFGRELAARFDLRHRVVHVGVRLVEVLPDEP